MASDRVQRQIDHLLDEAGEALSLHSWTIARDRAQTVLAIDPGNSNLRQAGVPVLLSETPSADQQPAPSLGQHSVEILQELGFSELEISDMCGARCIGVP